jgi:hypothetical protein
LKWTRSRNIYEWVKKEPKLPPLEWNEIDKNDNHGWENNSRWVQRINPTEQHSTILKSVSNHPNKWFIEKWVWIHFQENWYKKMKKLEAYNHNDLNSVYFSNMNILKSICLRDNLCLCWEIYIILGIFK